MTFQSPLRLGGGGVAPQPSRCLKASPWRTGLASQGFLLHLKLRFPATVQPARQPQAGNELEGRAPSQSRHVHAAGSRHAALRA